MTNFLRNRVSLGVLCGVFLFALGLGAPTDANAESSCSADSMKDKGVNCQASLDGCEACCENHVPSECLDQSHPDVQVTLRTACQATCEKRKKNHAQLSSDGNEYFGFCAKEGAEEAARQYCLDSVQGCESCCEQRREWVPDRAKFALGNCSHEEMKTEWSTACSKKCAQVQANPKANSAKAKKK